MSPSRSFVKRRGRTGLLTRGRVHTTSSPTVFGGPTSFTRDRTEHEDEGGAGGSGFETASRRSTASPAAFVAATGDGHEHLAGSRAPGPGVPCERRPRRER